LAVALTSAAPQRSLLLGQLNNNLNNQLRSLAPTTNDISNSLYTYDYQLVFDGGLL
jgi:hypothetical protein